MASPEGKTPDSQASTVVSPGLHPQSCMLCAQRKVKCDRQDPTCANCVKAKASCEYRAPLPRGPRKRKHLNSIDDDPSLLAERLAKCEELLRSFGLSPDSITSGKPPASVDQKDRDVVDTTGMYPRGRLMAEDGRLRYVENHLWSTVADEVPENEVHVSDAHREAEAAAASFDLQGAVSLPNVAASMALGQPFVAGKPVSPPLAIPRQHAIVLWDTFITNVLPLTKFIHGPTVEKQHTIYLNRPESLSRPTQALLAGIYYAGLHGMLEQDCEKHFGKSKKEMFPLYFTSCANALVEARFLGSIDIETLQGLIFFLLASRDKVDPRTTWSLVGVATRIAQYIGLHHDGEDLKLAPFETEMRRRLWWQIGILEASIGELSGFGPSTLIISSTVKPPTNLNDSDMDPGMKYLPPGRTGATEMMFVMLRARGGATARKHRLGALFMNNWIKHSYGKEAVRKQLDSLMADMEEIVEREFLRYCDLLNPLHRLVSIIARVFLCRLRLKACHPLRRRDAESFLTPEQIELSFENSLRIIQYDNLTIADKALQRFRWHIVAHFQWDALLHLLAELRDREVFDDKAVEAWVEIEKSFENHPELIDDSTKLLHIAVGLMCLKAWRVKETAHAARDNMDIMLTHPPGFIVALRAREDRRQAAHKKKQPASGAPSGQQPGHASQTATQNPLVDSTYSPDSAELMLGGTLDGISDGDFSFGLQDNFDFTFELPQDFTNLSYGNSNLTSQADWDYLESMMHGGQQPS